MLTKIIKRDGREVNFSIEKLQMQFLRLRSLWAARTMRNRLRWQTRWSFTWRIGHSEADGRAGAGRRGKGLD